MVEKGLRGGFEVSTYWKNKADGDPALQQLFELFNDKDAYFPSRKEAPLENPTRPSALARRALGTAGRVINRVRNRVHHLTS